MTKKPTRLAAGPIGPLSLLPTRRKDKAGSEEAILAALGYCIDNEIFPSIRKTVDNGSGFSETTLNRKRYKPLLYAAKQQYDERWGTRGGRPFDGTEPSDGLGNCVAADTGACAKDLQDAQFHASNDNPAGGQAAEVDANAIGPERLTDHLDPNAIAALASRLQAKVVWLTGELERRDEQLYHALGTTRRFGEQARRARQQLRDIKAELDAEIAQARPLPERDGQDLGDKSAYEDDD